MKIKEKLYGYLRRSEKYTKTDMVYLIKSGSWTTLGQTGNGLITFFLAVIFANYLPRESYGVYAYTLSLVEIFGLASLPGIKTSLIRTISSGFSNMLKMAAKEKFKWSILSVAISLGGAAYYFFKEDVLLGSLLLLAAFFFPILESAGLYDSFLIGRKLFKENTLYFLTTRLGFLAAVFLVLQISKNVFYILLAYLITHAFFKTIFFIRTLKLEKNSQKEAPGLNEQGEKNGIISAPDNAKKEMMSYAKNLSLMNILSQTAGQIDKIIVFHFLHGANLALYSFALAPVQQMKSLISPLDTILFPKFVKRDLPDIKRQMARKMIFLAGLTIVMVGIYIIVAPYFYDIFFPQYKESVLFSRIYSVALVFSLTILPKTALEAHAKIKSLYLTKIIEPLVKISLLLVLTVYFGILGTIAALMVSQFFNFLFTYYLFRKESV